MHPDLQKIFSYFDSTQSTTRLPGEPCDHVGKMVPKGYEERLLCRYTEIDENTARYMLHQPINSGLQCSDCHVQYCSSHIRDHIEMEGLIPFEPRANNN